MEPGRYGVVLDSSYLGERRVGDADLSFFLILTQEASKEADEFVLRVSLWYNFRQISYYTEPHGVIRVSQRRGSIVRPV
ncbi:MAG: hypothetical protein Roseis2KO_48260 [Roseivirga sp.]